MPAQFRGGIVLLITSVFCYDFDLSAQGQASRVFLSQMLLPLFRQKYALDLELTYQKAS